MGSDQVVLFYGGASLELRLHIERPDQASQHKAARGKVRNEVMGLPGAIGPCSQAAIEP